MKTRKVSEKNKNFFADVYDVVRLIPKGRVSTYGAIANYLGTRSGARMVGWAMNASFTEHPPVPAHRVVNRLGVLSGKMHFPSPETMQNRLEQEGVIIENDRLKDFQKHFWDPNLELEIDAD